MTTQKTKPGSRGACGDRPPAGPPDEVVDRLAGLLPGEELERALEGLEPAQVTGPGGLVSQLAGRVIETALGAELTEHLGYPAGEAPPGGAGNTRNVSTSKTLKTELGPVEIKTPRDRKGSFEPRLVGKRQTRLAGLDERVLGLYAGGVSVGDIAQHLTDLCGTEIGRDTVGRVTDAVLADVEAWRTRPLEAVYPIVYFDCLMVKLREDRSVRTRARYLAIGVTVEGKREPLGIWWQDTEGAKFWLAVPGDLHRRGVKDVLICCVDGLAGLARARALTSRSRRDNRRRIARDHSSGIQTASSSPAANSLASVPASSRSVLALARPIPVSCAPTIMTCATCGAIIRAISAALPVTPSATRSIAARLAANTSSAGRVDSIRPTERAWPAGHDRNLAEVAMHVHPDRSELLSRLVVDDAERSWANNIDRVGVDLGRGVSLAAGPFPQAALRTGRAGRSASGSPRTCRWSWGDQVL
jgi:Transposase, Mutator family